MKKLKKIVFYYEDNTVDCIDDDRAATLFQSRCNTSGILSGMEDYLMPLKEVKDENESSK